MQISLYTGHMASHMRAGLKLEGIQAGPTKMTGGWKMLPMGRGGSSWLGEIGEKEIGGN